MHQHASTWKLVQCAALHSHAVLWAVNNTQMCHLVFFHGFLLLSFCGVSRHLFHHFGISSSSFPFSFLWLITCRRLWLLATTNPNPVHVCLPPSAVALNSASAWPASSLYLKLAILEWLCNTGIHCHHLEKNSPFSVLFSSYFSLLLLPFIFSSSLSYIINSSASHYIEKTNQSLFCVASNSILTSRWKHRQVFVHRL